MSGYAEFLKSKQIFSPAVGFDVPLEDINPMLRGDFAFQADIVRWACKRGKAAIFAHTGLGKGPMQLEWSRLVCRHTHGNVLLLAPHICPLQLTVIRRAIELWSNPGDVVFSPFAGIGSEGYVALQEGRRFVGAELKDTYFKQCCRNPCERHRPEAASRIVRG